MQRVVFSSVAQSCPTLCHPVNHSTPGLPVPHQLLEFTQAHVHWVGDAIQPFHPLSSPSPSAPNPSQNQHLFQWVNSLLEVAKVLRERFWQNSGPIYDKNSLKVDMERIYLNIIKAIYDNPIANIILNGESWKHSLWDQEQNKDAHFHLFIQYSFESTS